MKCPKCGFARPLADQVCRRCKYVFDEDRFLELAPPRAAGRGRVEKFFAGRSWYFLEALRSTPWVPPLASLIPGLGHVIQGRIWLGVLYFGLVALFGWMSVTFFSETYGQMLFGLAVSMHATCILDTTPWARAPELRRRVLAMAAILSGLILLYWPLVMHLSERFVAAQRVEPGGRGWRPIQALSIDQLATMALLFVVTVLVSAWASRRLSSRES